jgi:hypothetical protein
MMHRKSRSLRLSNNSSDLPEDGEEVVEEGDGRGARAGGIILFHHTIVEEEEAQLHAG